MKKIRALLARQLVSLVLVLVVINLATGAGSFKRPWTLFSCGYLQSRMQALCYLGTYLATHFSRLPEPGHYDDYIKEAARTYGMDTHLIQGLIETESHFRYYALSPKGACGLMQLLPSTARSLNIKNPFEPKDNIRGGTRYLKQLTARFGGDLWVAVAAYNWGPTRMARIGRRFTPEMEQYIIKILKARFKYSVQENQGGRPESAALQ